MKELKNLIINMKPTMIKLKNNERISSDEKKLIITFYLEVIHFMSQEIQHD